MPAHEGDDLRLIEDAVRGAGDIARKFYGGEYRRWSKNRGEPVTEADLAVDRFLRERLLAARPSYGWLSEEGTAEENSSAQRIFIVDPIDGTTAFLKTKPYFSISVAMVEATRPVAGVVFNPITDECFTAEKSRGSFLNGNAIRVSGCASVEGCRVLGAKDMFAHPAWSVAPNTPWPEMHIETRNSIAYRMALVAAGVFDATLALSTKHDWDMAAADLIVQEAGGKVTSHDGSELHYGGSSSLQRSMVCAGPALHAQLIEKLQHVTLPQR